MTSILELGPIIEVRCCRVWPVYALWQWKRCGLCGEKPVPCN